jgi:hypothetical protein
MHWQNLSNLLQIPVCMMILGLLALESRALAAPRSGELEITVVDADTNEPMACRMHLKNARGRPRKAPKLPFLKDHFCFDGTLSMTLREGNYTFELECGPEYYTRTGHFSMDRAGSDTKTVSMKRIVDMSAEGWWAGDLHVHRRPEDIELLMRAEDLHVAQVVTWSDKKDDLARKRVSAELLTSFDTQRYYRILAGRDGRASGGLSLFNLDKPLLALRADHGATAEYPPGIQLAEESGENKNVWFEAETLMAQDLPVWVAHNRLDSVRLANHRYTRDGYINQEPSDRPRNSSIYAEANGLGRWSEFIYYQLLNCGLRIPPSAGSGSGDVPNPPGYNRVYVYCGKDFSYERWWEGLRAGRVVVTNGPLLRPLVEGQRPGHVFEGQAGKTLHLQPELKLATKDPIEYLEVVKNGRVENIVRLDEEAVRKGRLPRLTFDTSGWFLIRAVTNSGTTYRFASSGPYYVEFPNQPRISRKAAQFFCDWVEQRMGKLEIEDRDQSQQVRAYHRRATDFWQDLRNRATTD